MSWNPFSEIYNDVSNGNIGTGVLDLATLGAYSPIKDAYNAPFDAQKKGFDDVANHAEAIKQQRIQRQQDTLKQSLAALDPTRKAIAAVYGDPSTWTL